LGGSGSSRKHKKNSGSHNKSTHAEQLALQQQYQVEQYRLECQRKRSFPPGLMDLAYGTGIKPEDIISTLQSLNMLRE
jgi:hypothetical protein